MKVYISHYPCNTNFFVQEAKHNCVATETEKVLLYGQLPPIVKMDNTLGTLKACKHLALSSNCIEKITGLKGLDVIEVLSLGRNCIKKLEGLDDISATLRELWMSYNLIDKLNGIEKLTNLTVLYMRSVKKICRFMLFNCVCLALLTIAFWQQQLGGQVV